MMARGLWRNYLMETNARNWISSGSNLQLSLASEMN